ncbi:prevent-host-death family protein [Catenulispora sp. GP43]|uniref:type II toxin-antitoxin system Phd/YefM family antitoxin n=1 Tax=Catenulispora sp. GP43 TaxID=3156263 RepID=UPI003511C64D
MADTYTVTEARAHLGEVVNKARHGGRVIEITQHGKPAAFVISPELLAYYQTLEDEYDIAEAHRIKADGEPSVPHAEVAARFGLKPDGRPA